MHPAARITSTRLTNLLPGTPPFVTNKIVKPYAPPG